MLFQNFELSKPVHHLLFLQQCRYRQRPNREDCQQNKHHATPSQIKRINAIMLTCGFYDEAGDFAFEVGLPGKSGVGGGIVALLPNEFTIATWSPGLNSKGNSLLGMHALEQFTTKTKLSIFYLHLNRN